MKYRSTLVLAGVLTLAAYVGGMAFAESDMQESNMAMPMQISSARSHSAGSQRSAPFASMSKMITPMDQEKARLSVDMDQTAEKLDAKIYELKTQSLTTKGAKNRFQLHQKIKKLEGQKAALQKIQHKVSKKTHGDLSNARQDWDKLKSNIDEQLSLSSN